MGSAIIGEAVAGGAKGTVEGIMEHDPDVITVPLKVVGYSYAGFVATIFILGIIAMVLIFTNILF